MTANIKANQSVGLDGMQRQPMVDLFAGAGGLSLGLERAGFETVHAVEFDRNARGSYLRNRPHLASSQVSTDIRSIPRSAIRRAVASDVELVAGGPPCQGFSEVGKRHFDDERNGLFRTYINWVRELEPSAALFENVRGFTVKNGGIYYDALMEAFTEIGYAPVGRVFHATEFGVPQLRHRLVIIATKKRPKTPLKMQEATLAMKRPTSVMDAISDLPPVGPAESSTKYASPPRTVLQKLLRGQNRELHDHDAANHPASLVKAISFIPDGGNRAAIPAAYQPRSGYHNSYARLSSMEPAVAITSNMSKPSSARCIHPFQNRGLTAREGARLQTFPDAYRFEGGAVSRRLQIGNAVPPFMAECLGYFIRASVLGNPLDDKALARKHAMSIGAQSARAASQTSPRIVFA